MGSSKESLALSLRILAWRIKKNVDRFLSYTEVGLDWVVDFGGEPTLNFRPEPGPTPGCLLTGEECAEHAQCCQRTVNEGFDVDAGRDLCKIAYDDETNEFPGTLRCEPEVLPGVPTDTMCVGYNVDGPLDTFMMSFSPPFPPVYFLSPCTTIIPNAFTPTTCNLHAGIPLNTKSGSVKTDPPIPVGPFVKTISLGGFGISASGKMEYGSNLGTFGGGANGPLNIFDGLLFTPFPRQPGVEFWVAITFRAIPAPVWLTGYAACELSLGLDPLCFASERLFAKMVREWNKLASPAPPQEPSLVSAATQGAATREESETRRQQFKRNIAETKAKAERAASRRKDQLQYRLDTELYVDGNPDDPCIVAALTSARIGVPLIGGFQLGRGIGSYCGASVASVVGLILQYCPLSLRNDTSYC